MSFNRKTNNKGITLIALVITIIVLLILAGVSIATLTGDNGILTQASKAAEQTKQASAEEQVRLAVIGSYGADGLNYTELEKNLKQIEKIDESTVPSPITDSSFPISVKVDGYTIKINKDGTTKIIIVTTEPPTTPVSQDTIFIDKESGNKEAEIPKGFAVSSVEEEQKINTGLVVIAPDGSEFVWVPVDKETLCADGTEGKEIAKLTSGKDSNGLDNYEGKLYKFSGSGDNTTSKEMENYGQLTIGNREPDVVTAFDGDTTYLSIMNTILGKKFTTANQFKEYMQTEYNEIINSIKINGGFYVGRYEASLSDSTETTAATTGNIQSKKGIMPTSAENSETYRWYGLYAKQKVYASTLEGTTVKSAMIYGSTYDAMLNWAIKGDDKAKVTAEENENHSGGVKNTGTTSTDKINNIFDLEGNMYEWTAEANDTSFRVLRGGNCSSSSSPSSRSDSSSYHTFRSYGSRPILYL